MSKYASYVETIDALEELQRKKQQLENDDAVRKVLAFKGRLEELMKEHGVSRADVLQMWDIKEGAAGDDKKRNGRPMKTFRNPHTGQIVRTQGGNQKDLIAWRQQYGKDAVKDWVI